MLSTDPDAGGVVGVSFQSDAFALSLLPLDEQAVSPVAAVRVIASTTAPRRISPRARGRRTS